MANSPGLSDDTFLDSIGVARFLPDSVAPWKPLLLEGLGFFLGRLSPERQHEIMLGQLMLGDQAPPEQRLGAVLSQCPTLHKLGQVVARHRSLPAGLRHQLQALESLPASVDAATVVATIHAELPADADVALADASLAEGSVAVVHPFTFSADGVVRHGVFKVLKPGVEARLTEELEIWSELVVRLARRGRELDLPAAGLVDVLDSVKELLALEVRLEVEQANLAAAADFHAGNPNIVIPRLLAWCTPRMTAMERVFGEKITSATLSAGARRRLAEEAVAALVARPFWSDSPFAVIHADPHAGNLLATGDGRLAVLDWSLTARLAKADREALVDAALGGLTLNASRLNAALVRLTGVDPADPRLAEAADTALRRGRQFRLGGLEWLIDLLDDLFCGGGTDARHGLVLFRKAWLTLSGVAADLAPESRADSTLAREGLMRFVLEWPRRVFTPPGSRNFASHVSSSDLLRSWLGLCLMPARFWLGTVADLGPWAAGGDRPSAPGETACARSDAAGRAGSAPP